MKRIVCLIINVEFNSAFQWIILVWNIFKPLILYNGGDWHFQVWLKKSYKSSFRNDITEIRTLRIDENIYLEELYFNIKADWVNKRRKKVSSDEMLIFDCKICD